VMTIATRDLLSFDDDRRGVATLRTHLHHLSLTRGEE